jgi:RND superfamily putative drug exporter
MAIVPSIMMLFGKANWWFPARLDRILPKLAVDPDDLASPQADEPGTEPEPELAGTGTPSTR